MFAVTVLCLFSIAGCKKDSHKQVASPQSVQSSPSPVSSASNPQQTDCLAAARKALGIRAQVVRCGELNTPGIQEVVAVLPAKYPGYPGMAIWKMVILRQEPSGWHIALTAARDIQNEAGYVGLDYIDDDSKFMGYQLDFSDKQLDKQKGLDFFLTYIERADGGSEQSGIEIAWNPASGRYQEWAYGQDPEGFKPEIKNPPHYKGGVMIPPAPPK